MVAWESLAVTNVAVANEDSEWWPMEWWPGGASRDQRGRDQRGRWPLKEGRMLRTETSCKVWDLSHIDCMGNG